MSQALRKIAGNASKCNCTVIFLNQLRHKVCASTSTALLHENAIIGISCLTYPKASIVRSLHCTLLCCARRLASYMATQRSHQEAMRSNSMHQCAWKSGGKLHRRVQRATALASA